MNRYSKYSSTLIKNWLLKNGCMLSNEASTSESIYLKYGEVRIRISNHLPGSPVLNTLYLMVPVNNSHSFGVFVGKNYSSVTSVKELKSFLKALFIVADVKAVAQLAKINISPIKDEDSYKKKIEELQKKVGNQKIEINRLKTITEKYENERKKLTAKT